jgi:histidine kinase
MDPDNTTIAIRRRLWFKLTVSVGVVWGLLMTGFTLVEVSSLERRAVEAKLQSARWFSDTIKRASRYSMLKYQPLILREIIKDVGLQPGVETVRIFNKSGRIMYSSRPAEIGTRVNMKAEACYACHFQDRPLERLPLNKRSRIFHTAGPGGHRVVSVINPIYNEPACYTQCHANHPADRSVLGVLDIGVSLAGVDEGVAETTGKVIAFSIVIFVALAAVMSLFIFLFVNRPLSSLLGAIRRIRVGDYEHPIAVKTRDEISTVAESFEEMRRAVKDKTEALEESRRRFQTLFEQVPCYVTVQDRDFKLIGFNKMFERDFEADVGEYCYQAYKGRDSICEHCSVKQTFEDGQTHSSEEVVQGLDGTNSYILNLTAPVVDRTGEIVAVMEMATDVTAIHRLEDELRASEEKYRLFFNNDPNPIFVFDQATFEILDANDPASVQYQFTKAELIGRSFLDLTAGQDKTRVEHFVASGHGFLPRAIQVRRDNTELFVNLRASYGTYLGRRAVIVAAADITEQLHTEQQLFQAAKMATLGEMSAGVAHELNQPLSVLGTGANFLVKRLNRQGSVDPEVLREVALEMVGQVERAARIINHLREFGRKSDIEQNKVDLNRPIRGVFKLLGQQLRVRDIKVELDLVFNLPPIWADANRLEQVFINLVLNARDAIEERREREGLRVPGLIRVTTTGRDGRVMASVADNGLGVPDADKVRIFDPFFTTKDVGQGTGLGLSISYGIVRDYDGTIAVKDRPGGGALFELSFPAAGEKDEGRD